VIKNKQPNGPVSTRTTPDRKERKKDIGNTRTGRTKNAGGGGNRKLQQGGEDCATGGNGGTGGGANEKNTQLKKEKQLSKTKLRWMKWGVARLTDREGKWLTEKEKKSRQTKTNQERKD